jgi:hypothetical protein
MTLSQHISKVLEGTGRKSLLGLIFSLEGLKLLADGNVGWVLVNAECGVRSFECCVKGRHTLH